MKSEIRILKFYYKDEEYMRSKGPIARMPNNMLIIGSPTNDSFKILHVT